MEEEIVIVIKPRRQQQAASSAGASQTGQQLGERSDGVVRTFSNPAAAVRFLAQRIIAAED